MMKSEILRQSPVNLRLLFQGISYFTNKQEKDTQLSKTNICTKPTILCINANAALCTLDIFCGEEHS